MASFDHRQDGMKSGELNEAVGIIHRTLELESRDLDSSPGFITDPSCHPRCVPCLLRLSGFSLRMLMQSSYSVYPTKLFLEEEKRIYREGFMYLFVMII